MGLARLIGLTPRAANGSSRDASEAVRNALSLCRELLSEPGDTLELAQKAMDAYCTLSMAARTEFYDAVATEFSPDPEEVGRSADAYRKEPSAAHLARVLRTAEPARQELFRRLNLAPGGTRALIEMRRELLSASSQHQEWGAIEADLAHLLASWFNRAFLVLRRVDWHTPAIILEKLIAYEAVHQIQGWRDLRRRLEADRRCYAFFHPALPDEPLIFVEVALVEEMSGQVWPLLDPDSPVVHSNSPKCALFYSITNCHDGLRGVPFGTFLIRTVADELRREFPRLRTVATLSPLSGFVGWLTARARHHEHGPQDSALTALLDKLETPRWFTDKQLAAELQNDLVPLCAYYLLHAKHGKDPLDPVARFHLRNGACLDRIHWLGDTSAAGLQRSAGLTANYVYRLSELERNHRLYSSEHRIRASYAVERLARQCFLSRAQPGRR